MPTGSLANNKPTHPSSPFLCATFACAILHRRSHTHLHTAPPRAQILTAAPRYSHSINKCTTSIKINLITSTLTCKFPFFEPQAPQIGHSGYFSLFVASCRTYPPARVSRGIFTYRGSIYTYDFHSSEEKYLLTLLHSMYFLSLGGLSKLNPSPPL